VGSVPLSRGALGIGWVVTGLAVHFIPAAHDKLTRGRIHPASIWIPLVIILWLVVLNGLVAPSALGLKVGELAAQVGRRLTSDSTLCAAWMRRARVRPGCRQLRRGDPQRRLSVFRRPIDMRGSVGTPTTAKITSSSTNGVKVIGIGSSFLKACRVFRTRVGSRDARDRASAHGTNRRAPVVVNADLVGLAVQMREALRCCRSRRRPSWTSGRYIETAATSR
jgi:hypothetical protein